MLKKIILLIICLVFIATAILFFPKNVEKIPPVQVQNFEQKNLKDSKEFHSQMNSVIATTKLFQKLAKNPEKSKLLFAGDQKIEPLLKKLGTIKKWVYYSGVNGDEEKYTDSKERIYADYKVLYEDGTKESLKVNAVVYQSVYFLDPNIEFEKYPVKITHKEVEEEDVLVDGYEEKFEKEAQESERDLQNDIAEKNKLEQENDKKDIQKSSQYSQKMQSPESTAELFKELLIKNDVQSILYLDGISPAYKPSNDGGFVEKYKKYANSGWRLQNKKEVSESFQILTYLVYGEKIESIEIQTRLIKSENKSAWFVNVPFGY